MKKFIRSVRSTQAFVRQFLAIQSARVEILDRLWLKEEKALRGGIVIETEKQVGPQSPLPSNSPSCLPPHASHLTTHHSRFATHASPITPRHSSSIALPHPSPLASHPSPLTSGAIFPINSITLSRS